MDIVRFTTHEGHIDVTSRDLAAPTANMTDLELIAYAVEFFKFVYITITDVQSIEIIAR